MPFCFGFLRIRVLPVLVRFLKRKYASDDDDGTGVEAARAIGLRAHSRRIARIGFRRLTSTLRT